MSIVCLLLIPGVRIEWARFYWKNVIRQLNSSSHFISEECQGLVIYNSSICMVKVKRASQFFLSCKRYLLSRSQEEIGGNGNVGHNLRYLHIEMERKC